jgi:hypothetical protein
LLQAVAVALAGFISTLKITCLTATNTRISVMVLPAK